MCREQDRLASAISLIPFAHRAILHTLTVYNNTSIVDRQGVLSIAEWIVIGPAGIQPIQDQLGLKMEAVRNPIEVLVIDHVERTPTEN